MLVEPQIGLLLHWRYPSLVCYYLRPGGWVEFNIKRTHTHKLHDQIVGQNWQQVWVFQENPIGTIWQCVMVFVPCQGELYKSKATWHTFKFAQHGTFISPPQWDEKLALFVGVQATSSAGGITSQSKRGTCGAQFRRVDEHSQWWLCGLLVMCRVPLLSTEPVKWLSTDPLHIEYVFGDFKLLCRVLQRVCCSVRFAACVLQHVLCSIPDAHGMVFKDV